MHHQLLGFGFGQRGVAAVGFLLQRGVQRFHGFLEGGFFVAEFEPLLQHCYSMLRRPGMTCQ